MDKEDTLKEEETAEPTKKLSTTDKEGEEEEEKTEKETEQQEKKFDLDSEDDSDEEGMDSLEHLRKLVSQGLHLLEPPQEKLLNELTIDGIVDYIQQKGCKNIIVMAGAGISTAAGIPDFRSPNTGLYHNLEKYKLPHPQAIFEISYFKNNPEPFFVLAKELLPESFKPTVSHYFIRLLWEKGLLLRHYTQNIDTLERVAGLPYEKLVEAHGTFQTGKCLRCRTPYTLPWMKEQMKKNVIPKCKECTEGIVKPDIIFFGEMLPERFMTFVDHDFSQADLLIIMGSSLVVQPFASLIDRVKSDCPRLLINKEKAGMQNRIARFLGLKQGLVLDGKSSHAGRDVAWLGECDEGCQLLADKLGWGEELKALVAKEHERLNEEHLKAQKD